MRYAICYHLYNLKNVKNTHGGVLLLVKLYKWYQIAQRITYRGAFRKLWIQQRVKEIVLRRNIWCTKQQ